MTPRRVHALPGRHALSARGSVQEVPCGWVQVPTPCPLVRVCVGLVGRGGEGAFVKARCPVCPQWGSVMSQGGGVTGSHLPGRWHWPPPPPTPAAGGCGLGSQLPCWEGGGMRHANSFNKRKWTWWEVHIAAKQRVPNDESCNSDEVAKYD